MSEELSPEARRVLLKGVAAYMRATAPQELPGVLKPLRGFTDKALLARHGGTMLKALDAEPLRGRILEWLEARPSLPASVAEALKVAADRADGWIEQLNAAQREQGSQASPKAVRDDAAPLEAERARTRKAKEEVRKLRQRLTDAERASNATVAELKRRITDLEKRLVTLEKSARADAAAAARTSERLERELRKERKTAEKAVASAKELSTRLKETTKKLTAAKQQTAKHEASSVKKTTRPAPAKRPLRGPRKPLPIPKGRREDEPETLGAWLEADDVLLVIDGYNVAKAPGAFGELGLEQQRDRLVDRVSTLAVGRKLRPVIVFDGADIGPGGSRPSRGPVRVQYSKPGEIADDHIVALIEKQPPVPVVVVTNDRELQGRVARLGATVATAGQLLSLAR